MPLDLKSTSEPAQDRLSHEGELAAERAQVLARWEKERIYDRIREAHKGQPIYVLHDGPPYANGPIHLGTALNKTSEGFHGEVRAA